jgi:hypothetical protein
MFSTQICIVSASTDVKKSQPLHLPLLQPRVGDLPMSLSVHISVSILLKDNVSTGASKALGNVMSAFHHHGLIYMYMYVCMYTYIYMASETQKR